MSSSVEIEEIQELFDDVIHHLSKLLYCITQMEMQNEGTGAKNVNEWRKACCSSFGAASHICTILFRIITKTYPRESRDINQKVPHEWKENEAD